MIKLVGTSAFFMWLAMSSASAQQSVAASSSPISTEPLSSKLATVTNGVLTKSTSHLPSFPAVRGADAVQIAQQAITAMGGAGTFQSIQTWTVDGTGTSPSTNQSHSLHWELSGSEFRIESGTGNSKIITTSGSGQVAFQSTAATKTIPYHVRRAWIFPFSIGSLLQQEVADSEYSIKLLPSEPDSKTAMVEIVNHHSSIDELVTPQVWYFDTSTKLPTRIVYHQHDASIPSHYGIVTIDFADFRRIGAALIPFSITSSAGGHVVQTIQLNGATLNQAITPDRFAALMGTSL